MQRDKEQRPDVQVLMSAVIRLMSMCSDCRNRERVQVLVKLLREVRDHPDLEQQPAILASLAEANFFWLQAMQDIADNERADTPASNEAGKRFH